MLHRKQWLQQPEHQGPGKDWKEDYKTLEQLHRVMNMIREINTSHFPDHAQCRGPSIWKSLRAGSLKKYHIFLSNF